MVVVTTDEPRVTPVALASVTEKVSLPSTAVSRIIEPAFVLNASIEKRTTSLNSLMAAPVLLMTVSLMRLVSGSMTGSLTREKPVAVVMPLAMSLAKSVPSVAVRPAVSSEKEKL